MLTQQLGAARRTLTISQQQLGQNLNLLYKQGDVSALAVMLGAKSLDDALSKLDVLSSVADETQRVVGVARSARLRLVDVRASLERRRADVTAAVVAAKQTADRLESARNERLAFISSLRSKLRLERAQISRLRVTVVRVERKSDALQAAAAPAEAQSAPAITPVELATPATGRTITVTSTGYTLQGRTATGMPVGYGVVAVDPSVIPLGTRLTIPGYGEAVAADTGGAVRGATIDVWFPTLAAARAWGRRTVTITLH